MLMLPVPTSIINIVIEFFRYGSAEIVDRAFSLIGIAYIRDSLTFHLPHISIFIAKECSGIRSSIALVITTIIAGELFLRTFYSKAVLLLFTPFLTILKNGIRITTLTVLADKISTTWLTNSFLHHNGGIVFFAIILFLLYGLIVLLKKIESSILLKKTT